MKEKAPSEFENFDETMRGLLAVPYSELQKKLEREKRTREKKRSTSTTSSVRASSTRKKRVS
jgi:hypothetical protein